MGNEAFAHAARKLQFTIVGGEQVSPALVSKFKSHCPSGRLVNLYGPTETTVYATMTDLQPGDHVTIGRPLGNYRMYIMDENGRRLMLLLRK
jgi:non-ribosomal peptide synthetase component F